MIARQEIELRGTSETDVADVTKRVAQLVEKSGVQEGLCVVFVPGSTAAVTTIEYEPGVVEDLKRAIEKLAPRGERYAHDSAWGDGNGYAHVRAAMVGPSLAVPIAEGHLVLGTWQQLVVLDFDSRPRRRRVVVQISGES
ncbi:MAG: YjbQ family protein [Deltaproteobacteria bacterium]|nr:YjbQ family protein [Deltaproteobacteria bacterium]